jgi:hypothetical protein
MANVIGGFVLVAAVTVQMTLGCNFCSPGECEGAIHCEAYAKSACPTNVGCALKPTCTCDLPDMGQHTSYCDPETRCWSGEDASTKCGAIDGCVWKTACTGTILCSTFKDEDACRAQTTCGWAKNCG